MAQVAGLNERPLQKEGQFESRRALKRPENRASMKGPSRRRGNRRVLSSLRASPSRLNEGPLQKEGQFAVRRRRISRTRRLNEGPLQKEGPLNGDELGICDLGPQ
ncbi:protein of unknown function [Propionibacterium freudenreichii]|nr:protein of unknown function [Propionibacterium freudenreichii]